MSIRDFKKAASLFLDTVATFTSYELMDYPSFVTYTVICSMIALDRPDLREKVTFYSAWRHIFLLVQLCGIHQWSDIKKHAENKIHSIILTKLKWLELPNKGNHLRGEGFIVVYLSLALEGYWFDPSPVQKNYFEVSNA